MVVILSKDDCGLPRIDQDFNICGSTCLLIKSFTASSTMDVASCSSFLALMRVALALPLALNPLVLPSRGTPPMKTFASMVVGLSVLSTLRDSTVAVRVHPVLAVVIEGQPIGLVDLRLDRLLDLFENGRLQSLVEDVLDFALEGDTFWIGHWDP